MKLKRLILGLLAICSSAMASTVALWDFDDSFAMNGVSVPYSTNGAFVVSATDKSGNGNDLSVWADSGTSDRTWISTTDSYFGDFAVLSTGGGTYGDMRTVSNTVPAGVDISASTFAPNNFTVEAVFTHEQLGWQALACRQGNLSGNMPSFRIVINNSGRPQVAYRTAAGTQTELTAPNPLPISTTDWHHMAATAQGGTNLVLYVDGIEVASGSITNAGMEFDPNSGAGTDQGNTWQGGEWSIGRGMWTGAKSDGFRGKIDAVAISDDALVPTDFVLQFPITIGAVVPANGESTLDRTISATMSSFGQTISTLELYIDGSLVDTLGVAPEDIVATITYDGSGYSAGEHTAKVIATTTELQTFENEWTFTFIDEVPEPAPYAAELYNINYAGRTGSSVTVPDGTVLKAPSPTANDRWNNLIAPAVSWTPASPITINNAFGTNTINLTWSGRANDWGSGGWGYADLFNGHLGSGGFDGNMIISGLDTEASYDVYAYFTWGWTMVESTFSITEGTTSLSSRKYTPVQANAASYASIAEGQNYVILADIVPSAGGVIQVRTQSGDGGWSGMQIVKRSNVPVDVMVPYAEGDFLPADGSRFTNDVVNISGTLNDVDAQVDQMYLYLDGVVVDSQTGLFGGETASTVSYAASSLSNGLHTVKVTALGYGIEDSLAYTFTNEWSFYWFDHFPMPATTALELYNINIAGCTNNGIRLVSDGGILAAPSTGGASVWNNVYAPNAPWSNPGLVTLNAANEANANTVGFETGGSGWWDGPQGWAGFYAEFTALSNTIWGATVGDSEGGWTRFTGLDANATYDVYIYWTWNRNDDAKTYALTVGTANLPQVTIDTDRASLVANPTNYVAGLNYGVIAKITPSAEGVIELSPNYSCAYQLVKRGSDAGGPTVKPDIMSLSVSGGTAYLTWRSENGFSYKVMKKSSLTSGIWTEVTTVPGAGATTSTTVPAVSIQEFFKIEGN